MKEEDEGEEEVEGDDVSPLVALSLSLSLLLGMSFFCSVSMRPEATTSTAPPITDG